MHSSEHVRLIPPSKRTIADPTGGMVREQAIAEGRLWAGAVTTEPGMTSDWHHHGDHETSIYVLDGILRMEFGTEGGEVVEAISGDFLYVPSYAVHRESNTGTTASHLVVARAGTGAPTINVEGPADSK